MNVPFLDLKAQYRSIKSEVDSQIQEVIDNTAFVMGRFLNAFEQDFATYQGVKHVTGTNSGTSALAIALLALKERHDIEWPQGKWEAVVPANTFIATAEAVVQAGGRPVYADINEKTYNLTAQAAQAAITENTRVIIPVHLYGQPAPMDEIMQLAQKHNLMVLEDCAQAHGAKYKKNGAWTNISTYGHAAGFSFYPGKNLGAYGDGGAVGTNEESISEYIAMYRDHGSKIKYEHQFVGSTDRLDSLQATILRVKLKHLDKWNQRRRENAEMYKKYFSNVDEVIVPHVPDYALPVWHLYVIRVADRIGLQKFLSENGIGCGFHYKYPLHLQAAFSYLGYKEGDFPVTEKVMNEIISLPMFAELNEDQIKYVVEKVKEFLVSK
jgi:dTDP-4-amino-4,6-dideoxygalactose transaminase